MPAAPKLRQVGGLVRAVEIDGQPDTEQHPDSARDVGVPGKVVIKLQGIAENRDQRFRAAVEFGCVEDAVDQVFPQIVGHQRLLEQTHADEEKRSAAIGAGEIGLPAELLRQIGDAGDGAGLQGGKEGHGGQVFEQAGGALAIAAVEVDCVGERLKRVERKS